MLDELLRIKDLKVEFPTKKSKNVAVDGVDITIYKGEIFGIVGESGCGKSMTSLSVLRLISSPGEITSGEIWYDGQNILALSEKDLQQNIRGNKIAMIFQEPMTSLNPLITIGEQIMEPLRLHQKLSRSDAKKKAVSMLHQVGIPLAEKRFHEYPHTLSGGMRQRVMIAIAMCCQPQLLIADEPTTALDVTIQAQILKLMKQLRAEEGTSILLISHDLGVIANMCDRVAVMYCGKVVEQGSTWDIMNNPQHPYTKGLMGAMPKIGKNAKLLYNIPGTVPQNHGNISGCRFAERCEYCTEICLKSPPPSQLIGTDHFICCHHAGGVYNG